MRIKKKKKKNESQKLQGKIKRELKKKKKYTKQIDGK